MKKTLICLCLLFFCSQAFGAELKFAQVTDVHFSANPEKKRSSKKVSDMKQVLTWAVRSLNNKQPKFVVFMGDNIDKSNEYDLVEFLKITQSLKMKYYVALGNHDAHENAGVSKEDFWDIVKEYNKNNKSKKAYYTFSPNSHFLCVVLDGAVPFSPTAHGIFPEEELVWLDKTLTKNKNKKVLIFQHFPLIEPADNPTHTLLYKDKYKEVLDKHDNIISISSGHYHKAKVTTDEKGIYHISTPALVSPDYVYDLITIKYSKDGLFKIKVDDIQIKPIDLQ